MPLATGTHLGPYEILAPLGAGGMGEVYRAHDPKLNRDVAIKILPEALATDPAALARFEREAQAVAALSHPNILAIHDFGRQGDTAYAVMELLDGETLRARLAHGALPARKAVDLAVQLAEGLAAAHEKGIVHRDLKPENIFVTHEGRAKVLDFGLAKMTTAASDPDGSTRLTAGHTGAGTVMGTVGYMSPEQVRGEAVDHRSDIFAFGAVLYEMLTGRQAFGRETATESMTAILKEDPPEIVASGSTASPAISRIVQHCLEKKPGERFQSARDIAFALESASTPSTESRALVKPSRRATLTRAAGWTVALGLIALALAGAWRIGQGTSPQPTFSQVTFRRGNVLRARFTPDGQNIVYSAAWDGRPSEIFLSRLDGSGVRAVGLPTSDVMAVNARGELLILLKPSLWAATSATPGTLALASLDGGTPRELLAHVQGADFGPDGQAIAAIYYKDQDGGPYSLDYPLGTRLMTSTRGAPRAPRVSPRGDQVAFVCYTGPQLGNNDTTGSIAVVDRAGKRRDFAMSAGIKDEYLAWSPDGREIYFTAPSGVLAMDLDGHTRAVNPDSTPPLVQDVSAQGVMLLEREVQTVSPVVRSGGADLGSGVARPEHARGILPGRVAGLDLGDRGRRIHPESALPEKARRVAAQDVRPGVSPGSECCRGFRPGGHPRERAQVAGCAHGSGRGQGTGTRRVECERRAVFGGWEMGLCDGAATDRPPADPEAARGWQPGRGAAGVDSECPVHFTRRETHALPRRHGAVGNHVGSRRTAGACSLDPSARGGYRRVERQR